MNIRRTQIVVVLLLASLPVSSGCASASEFDGRHYKHHGMHFSLDVPRGWTLSELSGDLVVELTGPAAADKRQAAVHVFSRREPKDVDVARTAELLSRLMVEQMAEPVRAEAAGDAAADEAGPTVDEPCQVGGLPGRRVVRPVRAGGVIMQREVLLVARGSHVWALMSTMPPDAGPEARAALDEIKKGFAVW